MATETITDTNRGASPHTPRPTKKQVENDRRSSEMEMQTQTLCETFTIMLPGED